MLLPAPRLLRASVLLFPVAALPAIVGPAATPIWLALVGVAAVATVIDAMLAVWPRSVKTEVRVPDVIGVGSEAAMEVLFTMAHGRRLSGLACLVDVGAPFESAGLQRFADVDAHEFGLRMPLVARERGRAVVRAINLRWRGPLGLVELRTRRAEGRHTSVVPDLDVLRRHARDVRVVRQTLMGQRSTRTLGEGSEFDSLREFVPGMDHRAINWTASARHRLLLARQFRAERDQQVILALDTGRLTREPIGSMTRLDHAIHGSLVMAWSALKEGDRVGICGFDARLRTWSEPRSGMDTFSKLREVCAGLKYGLHDANHTLSFTEIATRLTRRSLIMVFTEFSDSASAGLLTQAFARLGTRHLVVFVSLIDPELARIADAEPTTLAGLGAAVVAGDLRRDKELVLAQLGQAGIMGITATPDRLTWSLVDRYIHIKHRGLVA